MICLLAEMLSLLKLTAQAFRLQFVHCIRLVPVTILPFLSSQHISTFTPNHSSSFLTLYSPPIISHPSSLFTHLPTSPCTHFQLPLTLPHPSHPQSFYNNDDLNNIPQLWHRLSPKVWLHLSVLIIMSLVYCPFVFNHPHSYDFICVLQVRLWLQLSQER